MKGRAMWHVLGQNLGAQVAVLALARAAPAQDLRWTACEGERALMRDPTRILALSPHSVQCLADWGVRLTGLTPIRAMQIASRSEGGGLRLEGAPAAPLAFTLALDALRDAVAAALTRAGRAVAPASSAPLPRPQLVFLAARAAWRQSGAAPPRRRAFRQHALSALIAHEQAHGGAARQVFLRRGPLALLPLPQRQSALIWTLPSKEAHALANAPAHQFEALLRERSGDALGRLELASARQLTELVHYQALGPLRLPHLPFGAAAQLVHPLAGLGFNLTVRDVAGMADCAVRARDLGLPPASPSLWETWWRTRRADAALVGGLTGGLNRIFAARGALRPLAGLGLALLGAARAEPRAARWQAPMLAYANRGLA